VAQIASVKDLKSLTGLRSDADTLAQKMDGLIVRLEKAKTPTRGILKRNRQNSGNCPEVKKGY
jgi:hypothetical protein